ncbi:MAG: hypothetical protein V8S58_15130 [Lachnospiraceae bacterium]
MRANLLGTGTMESACLIKNWLEEKSLSGTVIYGCRQRKAAPKSFS